MSCLYSGPSKVVQPRANASVEDDLARLAVRMVSLSNVAFDQMPSIDYLCTGDA